MSAFFLSMWIVVAGFFGLSVAGDTVTPETSTTDIPFPTGTPVQSAPPQTISACAGKVVDDACTYTLGSSDAVDGVCSSSGDALACGPTAIQSTEDLQN